jgi:hypothetical protein
MDHMIFMDSDGIITDNLSDLQDEIHTLFKDSSYSKRMTIYVTQMQDPFE